MDFLKNFLLSYDYENFLALIQSVFPTTRYIAPGYSITISSVIGITCAALGVWPILVLAMFIIMMIELVSGIYASRRRGEPFESSKFSRFFLKLAIWFLLLICCQLFAFFTKKYGAGNMTWLIGSWFFDVLTVILMISFVVENVTSILENLASIEKKDKSYYINIIKEAVEVAYQKIIHK